MKKHEKTRERGVIGTIEGILFVNKTHNLFKFIFGMNVCKLNLPGYQKIIEMSEAQVTFGES